MVKEQSRREHQWSKNPGDRRCCDVFERAVRSIVEHPLRLTISREMKNDAYTTVRIPSYWLVEIVELIAARRIRCWGSGLAKRPLVFVYLFALAATWTLSKEICPERSVRYVYSGDYTSRFIHRADSSAPETRSTSACSKFRVTRDRCLSRRDASGASIFFLLACPVRASGMSRFANET
ncbi:uncharacterized protein LOC143424448 [Xylocopa sonorina]|uniref:uncharacterized protein LOC143424448 n=1 Tax=Xylocopa sonorina TaxID=1818115 RepID=UPI00403AF1F4